MAIGINRREIIVRMAGAASGVALWPLGAGAQPSATDVPPPPKGSRDPADPDLLNPQLLWTKLLTAEERATAAAVCDVILPADDKSPAASKLDVHDFIDEWVSAPYPRQIEDRQIIRGGLTWINTEADKRFGKRFVELDARQKDQICAGIAWAEGAPPDDQAGAHFFARMRHLTMVGFYTTVEGMKDLGYVGNVAAPEWKGPPAAILRKLGLL
jgi:gluconate 2-dehydrogenase gamma chain